MKYAFAISCLVFGAFLAGCNATIPVDRLACVTSADCPSGVACGANHFCGGENDSDAGGSTTDAAADGSTTSDLGVLSDASVDDAGEVMDAGTPTGDASVEPDSGSTAVDAAASDSGASDASIVDLGTDAGTSDGGTTDSGVYDSGTSDSGISDSGVTDGGTTDSGASDSGTTDSGSPDGGISDSGSDDSGVGDGGAGDSGLTDGSVPPTAEIYVKASNTLAGQEFGCAIAISADGNTLAVGAHGDASDATGINGDQTNMSTPRAGAVYVFHRIDGVWAQEAYIKASNTRTGANFGEELSLAADGNTLAVGSPTESSNATGIDGDQLNSGEYMAGAVYLFRRQYSSFSGVYSWGQAHYIKASNTTAHVNELFGSSVALSADGASLAVGAYYESSGATGINGNQNDTSAYVAGAVYLFRFSYMTGAWSQQAYIKASNTRANQAFGYKLALSSDGNTLAVSATWEASNATGVNGNQSDTSAPNAGAVYVYRFAAGAWSQQAYVKASNTAGGQFFGTAVSLSADGNTLAVGAYSESSNATGVNGNQANTSAPQAGAAYLYRFAGGSWSQQAYLKASNTRASANFGAWVALTADGNTLAVGAQHESSNATGVEGDQSNTSSPGAGAVYIFNYSASAWSQATYIKASNTKAHQGFGWPLALSSDGSTLAVSATQESSHATGINGDQSDTSAAGAGAAYVIALPTNTNRVLSLNGTPGGVRLPPNASFGNIGTHFTIEAWVKPTTASVSDFSVIFVRRAYFADYVLSWSPSGNGELEAQACPDGNNSSTAAYVNAYEQSPATLNVWHHIANVVSGNQVTLFVDGVLQQTSTSPHPITWSATDARATAYSEYGVFIGYTRNPGDDGNPSYVFPGEIDDVRVSNVARYSANFTPQTHFTPDANTVGLWTFDDVTSGTVVRDSSSNGLNGTMLGSATCVAEAR